MKGDFYMGNVKTANFINSIKGGCGKTTFSIFLSRYLSCTDTKKKEKLEKNDACLILDMDFQGTSMQFLFEANYESKGKVYLNNAIRELKEPSNYIQLNTMKDGISLPAIYADPNIETKLKYRVSAQSNYSPVIQYNVFRGGLAGFLKKLNECQYQHLIFDMPPNSDGFSDAAMDSVMNSQNGVFGKECKINLFFLMGYDLGHIGATISEVENVLKQKENRKFDNLMIVINDNIVRRKLSGEDVLVSRLKEFKDSGVFDNLTKSERKRIHFIVLAESGSYATWCMEGKGLNNAPVGKIGEIFSKIPATQYANIDDKEDSFKNFLDDKDETFLKELLLVEEREDDLE